MRGLDFGRRPLYSWVPAFAGMTGAGECTGKMPLPPTNSKVIRYYSERLNPASNAASDRFGPRT